MKSITETQTPFQKFKQLTERLLTVPKKELDEKMKEYERKGKGRKKKQSKK